MKDQAVRLVGRGTAHEGVWCEPLQFCFPRIYRVVKRKRAVVTATSSLPSIVVTRSDFELADRRGPGSRLVDALPLQNLSPHDDDSLVVRHHSSFECANAHLQGVEDAAPARRYADVFQRGSDFFTLAKCETRKSWGGPTIFYLADVFDDAVELGVYSWERSVGIDGELRVTDVFYND